MSNHKENCQVHIVGAGVSGLIAAQLLESHGYSPIVFEADNRAGGRLKTDIINGYQLDHGFQVLLTAYPMAQKYLDYEALELQTFLPGASIFFNNKRLTIGDPIREISLLLPTLMANLGRLSDKIKILQLNQLLKKKTLDQIFNQEEKSTLDYLRGYGFSDDIIQIFFKPFFGGIFLEPQLETSSRMFEFVFKMFGSGLAALPKSGIAAIPAQLVKKLNRTTFKFSTPVKRVEDGRLILSNGEVYENHYAIIATEANHLVRNLDYLQSKWRSCDNLYFETGKRVIRQPLIGLVSDPEALINNIFYHTSLQTASAPAKELLSVTVVRPHHLGIDELKLKVEQDLAQYCGIKDCQFIKHYRIEKALPQIDDLKHEMLPSQTKLTDSIYLAGDQLLNGSLNAAMVSGERAAMGIIEKQM